jgi:hypothetical protein
MLDLAATQSDVMKLVVGHRFEVSHAAPVTKLAADRFDDSLQATVTLHSASALQAG